MADTRLTAIITETITNTTAELTKAVLVPRGAVGFEISGTGVSTPTFQLCPRIRKAFFFDASGSSYTDVTQAISERGATNLLTLDSMDASPVDYLYIGCDVPFRGVRINVNAANANASVATWEYDASGTWTDTSDTDGTASGGATLAIDNTVTWTVPTDWTQGTVNGVGTLYWVRMKVSADLDTEVEVSEIVALSVETNRPSTTVQTGTTTGAMLPRFWINRDAVGGLETTGDNLDTSIVNWLCSDLATTLVAQ